MACSESNMVGYVGLTERVILGESVARNGRNNQISDTSKALHRLGAVVSNLTLGMGFNEVPDGIAEVQIALDQLMMLLNIEDNVKQRRQEKVFQMKSRIYGSHELDGGK